MTNSASVLKTHLTTQGMTQLSSDVSSWSSNDGGRLERLQHAEQLADAADEQALLLDLDPDAGRRGEDDVVAGADRHVQALRLPPVDARADRQHDPVLGRRLVVAGRHDEAGAPDPVGIQLLDDHPVEQWAQLVTHRRKGYACARRAEAAQAAAAR